MLDRVRLTTTFRFVVLEGRAQRSRSEVATAPSSAPVTALVVFPEPRR
jgi:hypothetical protein